MTWIKKIEPVTLSQESDIPFVILEDGVKLCFSNLYREGEASGDDHKISFQADRDLLMRQSSNYFKFKRFPVTLSFDQVLQLDDAIAEGRVIKTASEKVIDEASICIAKSTYIRRLNEDDFQDFAESLENYDHSFVLVGDIIDPSVRVLDDLATIVAHRGWGRTCVKIANHLCCRDDRKYGWTNFVPPLDIGVYGLEETKQMDVISEIFSFIGVEVCTRWNG